MCVYVYVSWWSGSSEITRDRAAVSRVGEQVMAGTWHGALLRLFRWTFGVDVCGGSSVLVQSFVPHALGR